MKTRERDELRRAVADYMQSEGCSCCQDDVAHAQAEQAAVAEAALAAALAALLAAAQAAALAAFLGAVPAPSLAASSAATNRIL